MWRVHLWHILGRSASESLTIGGTTGVGLFFAGLVVAILGFAITVAIEMWRGRPNMTLKKAAASWPSFAGAVGALVIVWVSIFLFSIGKNVYRDHMDLAAAAQKKCPVIATSISPHTYPAHSEKTPISIHIQQSNGGTANPGVTTAPVTQAPCSVFQNGGSGNVASPICSPVDRRLTVEEFKAIKNSATANCPTTETLSVTGDNSNHEALRYASDFVAALRAAGCHADLALPIPGLRPDVEGVHIGFRQQSTASTNIGQLSPEVQQLDLILTAANIKHGVSPMETNFFPSEATVLIVGARRDDPPK
jgi:hypothetical protein